MSRGSDPRLFFSIDNIRAFHLQNGEESELTQSGPQTLSLLMVPTASPFIDSSQPDANVEEDFYLHLHLPPELDLPLPATTQIYHQPPNSYLIPRWDLGPNSGAFTRIQFPGIGSGPDKVTQEDVDTFETILAQCTAFLERASPPWHTSYNPSEYALGEGYVGAGPEKPQKQQHGQIVLVDEEDGSVVGELTSGFNVVESPDVKPGSKNPVEIQLPVEGYDNRISISNVPDEYLQTSRHPAYSKSTIVQTSATASRLLVTGSAYIAKGLQSGADNFTKKTKPCTTPMTFSPITQARIRKINTITHTAAGVSSKTVGQISRYAQNLGAAVARRSEKDLKPRGYDKDGEPIYDYKPGVLNKSMIAFSTIADGIEQSARTLLESGSRVTTTVVGHRYGAEAGTAASNLTSGAKNVGLVYIDAAGVSRKAILKSVAKGMVVGRMPDGKQLVVGGRDNDQAPFQRPTGKQHLSGSATSDLGFYHPESESSTPPPAYGAKDGRFLGGTPMQTEKR